MKDEPEEQVNDGWLHDNPYPPRRRRIESDSGKYLRILAVFVLVLIIGGGLIYFLSKRPTGGQAAPLQSMVVALEQRITGLEKQLTELEGKINDPRPDPGLLHRVEALTQKVETLEKQIPAIVESAVKPSPPPKPAVPTDKQYHTVQKGENLYRISKKYGISVEELRKLNNLSADQPIRMGQKLLVSPKRQ